MPAYPKMQTEIPAFYNGQKQQTNQKIDGKLLVGKND